MKYESPITCHSKYMAIVKGFEKWVKLQGQGHKVKNKNGFPNCGYMTSKHICKPLACKKKVISLFGKQKNCLSNTVCI
jgi:hypothetical protein